MRERQGERASRVFAKAVTWQLGRQVLFLQDISPYGGREKAKDENKKGQKMWERHALYGVFAVHQMAQDYCSYLVYSVQDS